LTSKIFWDLLRSSKNHAVLQHRRCLEIVPDVAHVNIHHGIYSNLRCARMLRQLSYCAMKQRVAMCKIPLWHGSGQSIASLPQPIFISLLVLICNYWLSG
jgi:hypothetical protein